MLQHHFEARLKRLQRLVAEADARVNELSAIEDQTPTRKRLFTMAKRALLRHRESLSNLLAAHGATFGVTCEPGEGKPEN